MKVNVTHEDVSRIDACTFNMICKGDKTEKWGRDSGNSEVSVTLKTNATRIGIHDYASKVTQWKIPVKETIDKIEKNNNDSVDKSIFLKSRKCISEITVILWEPEFLPFNYVILLVNFRGLLIEPSGSHDELDALFCPIVHHCKLSEGQIPEYNGAKFPAYYRFYYDTQTMKLALSKADGELTDVKQAYERSKGPGKELEMQYIEKCNELKQNSLFNNFNFSSSDISLINIQDNFFILGTTGNRNSSWYNVASIEPDSYSCSRLGAYLPDFPSGFLPLFFLPYVLAATFAISVGVHRTKLKEIYTKIDKIKKEIT